MKSAEYQEPEVGGVLRYIDDRGYLDQLYAQDLPFKIKRIYSTLTRKGIIRGMHGHKKEWKALFIIQGTVKVVTEAMSKNKYTKQSTILSDDEGRMVIIPPKWYHGYMPLTDEAIVMIISSATLEESKNDDFRLVPLKEDFEVINR
jgi:dTDP-4-dehydrorhamnose 3,5-epimerase-like enzyme